MFTLLRHATLALYADTVSPRQLLVPHFFEISDEFRRDLWVVVKSASVEMNVHSWQGLVAGTCGHQTRYLDQRSAQNPKCIALSPKHVYTPATRNSGLVRRHGFPETTAGSPFLRNFGWISTRSLSSCEISICRNERTQLAGSCSRYMWSPDPLSRSKIRAKSEMYRTFSQTCLHSCDTQLWPCTPTRFPRDDCWFPISSKFRMNFDAIFE